MNDCADFCKVMSDETRQRILRMLMEGEKNVSEIVEAFEMSQPTISHHLNVLKQLGLVTRRKEGKQVYYAIDKDRVVECCGQLVARFDAREENMEK